VTLTCEHAGSALKETLMNLFIPVVDSDNVFVFVNPIFTDILNLKYEVTVGMVEPTAGTVELTVGMVELSAGTLEPTAGTLEPTVGTVEPCL